MRSNKMSRIIWTPEKIKENLFISDKWVERSILVLYSYQTEEEKAGEHTGELNGVGFSRYDSPMLSSYAKWINEGSRLSVAQLRTARNRLRKYAGQLANIANDNEREKRLDKVEAEAIAPNPYAELERIAP
jgi:hypothetical protein